MAQTDSAVKGKIQVWKDQLDEVLHQKNPFTNILAQVEDKTKVRRLYIVLGLAAFSALWLMVGYGAQFLANFIGFVYPAYASIKAIESKEKDDDKRWLTYWVVYSVFSLLEFFTDILLFWIPFYCLLKCIFFLYCMVPTKWNGSIMIYDRIIRPFFLKHQSRIDKHVSEAAEVATDLLREGEEFAQEAASDYKKTD